jgi:hypothetical protein
MWKALAVQSCFGMDTEVRERKKLEARGAFN